MVVTDVVVMGIILELIPSHGLRLISDVVAEEGAVFPTQDVGDGTAVVLRLLAHGFPP